MEKSKKSTKKPSTKKESTKKEQKKTADQSSTEVKLKINKEFFGFLTTIIIVVVVAVVSFFLAYSLKGDIGTSIPNDYSRYIADEYVIGFPGGWALVPANTGTFGATGDNLETGETGGSLAVNPVALGEFLPSEFEGINEEGCQQVIDFIEGSQIEPDENYSAEFTMIKINRDDACQMDITNTNPDDSIGHTRIIMIDNPSSDDTVFFVTGAWDEGAEYQGIVEMSLRTFKLLEVEDKEEEEEVEESQDDEAEDSDSEEGSEE